MSLTDDDKQWIKNELRSALDASALSVAADRFHLWNEMIRRIEALERRFEIQAPTLVRMEARLSAIEGRLAGIDGRISGLTRVVDGLIADNAQTKGAIAGIDRALRTIVQRREALERISGEEPRPKA